MKSIVLKSINIILIILANLGALVLLVTENGKLSLICFICSWISYIISASIAQTLENTEEGLLILQELKDNINLSSTSKITSLSSDTLNKDIDELKKEITEKINSLEN